MRYSEFDRSQKVEVSKEKIRELITEHYGYVNFEIREDNSVVITGECELKNLTCESLPDINLSEVTGQFVCTKSAIKTLKNSPKIVRDSFFCYKNENLESLVGGPTEVHGHFNCSADPKLHSLEGSPTIVTGSFLTNHTSMGSLKGLPKTIGRDLDCENMYLKSLEGIEPDSKLHGTLRIDYNPKMPLLRSLMMISGIEIFNCVELEDIINNHKDKIRNGMPFKKAVLECQYAMIKAGYKGNARW